MKKLGRSGAFVLIASLLLILAIAQPIVWLAWRDSARRQFEKPDAAAQYVAMLEDSQALVAVLRDQDLIGYASESEVDIRTGGPAQARYYLSQFALAPVLVDLGAPSRPDDFEPEFVLANFDMPHQLNAYLVERARVAVVSLNANVALTQERERR